MIEEFNIDKYLAELRAIIRPTSFLEKASLMPFCEDLVDSIVNKEDFIYYNDNAKIHPSDTTKSSLIYKIMFDFSEDSALIFTDGFNKEVFDKDYVVDSFRRFIFRVLDSKSDHKIPPLIIISKDRIENLSRNLEFSDFFQEVKRLQKSAAPSKVYDLYHHGNHYESKEYFEIKSIQECNIEIGIDISQKTIINEGGIRVSDMNSFSVFDKFYRLEQSNNSSGCAYVNFGDEKNADILSNFFYSLKDKAHIVEGGADVA